MSINAQYNVAAPGSLPVRLAHRQRRRMYTEFLRASGVDADDTLLDVGATSDRLYDHSNYVVRWYPHKRRITAIGIDDASHLRRLYSGVTVLRGDGLALPFAACSFDWVHASAVLEHVGSEANQVQFLRELWRVARKGVFLTTPNRWYPIEFHTVLPLIHWLPKPWHRRALRNLGNVFFAEEKNLNLLSANGLTCCARAAGIGTAVVSSVRLFAWPSNLLLCARKAETSPYISATAR